MAVKRSGARLRRELLVAAVVGLSACSSPNKKALEVLAPEDLITRIEVLEQESVKNPNDAELAVLLEDARSQLATRREGVSQNLRSRGWTSGANRVDQASIELTDDATKVDAVVANDRRLREGLVQFGRAWQALELQEPDVAEELLDSIDVRFLYPSTDGVKTEIAARRRIMPVLALLDKEVEPVTPEFLQFLNESRNRDASNQLLDQLIAQEEQFLLARQKLEEAKSALNADQYASALRSLDEARQLDSSIIELDDVEEAIRQEWAAVVYNEALLKARNFTKRDLAEASAKFDQIEKEIVPGYRDAGRWKSEVDLELCEIYTAEARDCLRYPGLLRVSTAVAALDKALEWVPGNPEAAQLHQMARNLEEQAVASKLRVRVEGDTEFAAEVERRLVEDLRGKGYPRMTVAPGLGQELIRDLNAQLGTAGYAPYPGAEPVPWNVLELYLRVYSDEATREGDDLYVMVSSARVDAGANRTITNPDQMYGAQAGYLVDTTIQTIQGEVQQVNRIYEARLAERNRTKAEYEQALSIWQAANARLQAAQTEMNNAQSNLKSAETKLTVARGILTGAELTYNSMPRTKTETYTDYSTSPPTTRSRTVPNEPALSIARAAVEAARIGVRAAESNLASARSRYQAAEQELGIATQEELQARSVRDEKKRIYDEAERLFQLANNVKTFADQRNNGLQASKSELESLANQSPTMPHEYWQTYQYRAGTAGVRARLYMRGWLVDTQGDVVLHPFIEEHVRHEQDEFRLDVADSERLDVRTDQPDLPEVDDYHRQLREETYEDLLKQADQVLQEMHQKHLYAYQKARAQGRNAEALESALRYLSHIDGTSDPNRRELEEFVETRLEEIL